jgi:hypothetical protein
MLIICPKHRWIRRKLVNSRLKKFVNEKGSPVTDASALEDEIDQLVYQLYDLTEEEVKIVETAGK